MGSLSSCRPCGTGGPSQALYTLQPLNPLLTLSTNDGNRPGWPDPGRLGSEEHVGGRVQIEISIRAFGCGIYGSRHRRAARHQDAGDPSGPLGTSGSGRPLGTGGACGAGGPCGSLGSGSTLGTQQRVAHRPTAGGFGSIDETGGRVVIEVAI